MNESAPDCGAVGVTDYIPFQAGSSKPAENERGRSEDRGEGWQTQTQGGRWRSGSRAPSVARSEDYSRAGDPGLQYGEKTGSERPSSVGAQPRVPAEYSEEQLARDRVPLATGALQRKRDSRYWASLQAVSPADILSTSAALEPEMYRETVEPIHPEHSIVRLGVMRTHPHRAMDAWFGRFIRYEWDLNSVEQRYDGFVATALELRELYDRAKFHCQKWVGREER